MGIRPSGPDGRYGYIIPEDGSEVSRVLSFEEKPDEAEARDHIARGGLWNGGAFACRLDYILERARDLIGFSGYSDLLAGYGDLEGVSFDYAVVEHEPDIAVLRFGGDWKDVGTWDSLSEAMDGDAIGDVRLDACRNVRVVNELGIPIAAIGIEDAVVAAGPDGILVASKAMAGRVKEIADGIGREAMFAEKSWGSYRVLDASEGCMTILVTLNPGHGMNYHSHERRDEVWTVVSGEGRTIVDGMEQPVRAGDVIAIAAGCRHTVIAGDEPLRLVEVQLGREISVHDKMKHDLEGA